MRRYEDTVVNATSPTDKGAPVYKAQIRVLNADSTPAQLFSDNGATFLSQPVLTNGLGDYFFYVADGTYSLVISDPSGNNPVTIPDVQIYDIANLLPNIGSASANALTNIGAAGTTQVAAVNAAGAGIIAGGNAAVAAAQAARDQSITAQHASEAARDQSGTYATNAGASAAQAQGIANTAGALKRYSTYALAVAALASIAAGEFIEVQTDETHGGRITRYHKSGSVLVFDNYVSAPRTVYLKAGAAGTGSAALDPVGTIAAACALLTPGSRLRASGRFFGGIPIGVLPADVYIEPLDDELIFDGSRPITSANIQPHATLANTYYVDVAHQLETRAGNNAGGTIPQVIADCCHFAMWQEVLTIPYASATGYCLEGNWPGTSIATNEAYVGANPGTCTVYIPGTSQPDARIDFVDTLTPRPAGTVYRYVFQLPDSSDPRTGNRTMYYAEQEKVLNLSRGCGGRNFTVQRTAAKDMAGNNDGYGPPLENVKFLDAAIHAYVGPNAHVGNFATARVTSLQFTGGAFHGYLSSDSPSVPAPLLGWGTEGCEARGFGIALYSHAGTLDAYTRVVHRNFKCSDCNQVIATSNASRGWHVDGLIAVRCTQLAEFGTPVSIKNFFWSGSPTGSPLDRVITNYDQPLLLENGIMAAGPASAVMLYNGSGATYAPVYGKNMTIVGGYVGQGGTTAKFDLHLTNSIFEGMAPDGTNLHLTAVNSYVTNNLSNGAYSKEDLIATYGWSLDAPSTTPWVRQSLTYTVAAGDITGGRFNKVLFPQSAGNVRPTAPGSPSQALTSDVTFDTPKLFAAGMWVRIGGKVAQILTYNVATGRAGLDRKILFVVGQYTPEGGNGPGVAPVLPVSFGFQSRPEYYGTPDLGPTYSVTTSGTTSTGAEDRGTSSWQTTDHYRASTQAIDNFQRLNHRTGEIDEAFGGAIAIAVGTTITVNQTVYIPEFAPTFSSVPALSGRADLVPNNELALRGMGHRA